MKLLNDNDKADTHEDNDFEKMSVDQILDGEHEK